MTPSMHNLIYVCVYTYFFLLFFFFAFLRGKYEELLSDFSKLQSEKASVQQLVESESLNAKTTDANLKV